MRGFNVVSNRVLQHWYNFRIHFVLLELITKCVTNKHILVTETFRDKNANEHCVTSQKLRKLASHYDAVFQSESLQIYNKASTTVVF